VSGFNQPHIFDRLDLVAQVRDVHAQRLSSVDVCRAPNLL
jgi:hypothetical protein